MKKTGVAIIHGMGNQNRDFADKFIKEIKAAYENTEEGKYRSSDIYFKPVYWADVLNDEERKMWNNLNLDSLDFRDFRKFIVNYLGDAIAYQKMYDLKKAKIRKDISVYYKVQTIISDSLKDIDNNTEKGSPLVLIGHSLGTVMLMNYIYDSQKTPAHKKLNEWKDKCDTDNLTGLFLCGSPFALWTLRKKDFGEPVNFPGKNLSAQMKKRSRWLNIYDPDDILAYPLKNLNTSYKKISYLEDKAIEVGGLLTGGTPLSHSGYFKTADVIKLIAEFLKEISPEH